MHQGDELLTINKILEDSHEKLKKSLEELSNTETLLSSITNLSSDVIYIKDSQSRWIFANPALERIVGKKSDELLGKNDLEIYSNHEIGNVILENDRRIMDSGKEETLEEIIETPKGLRSFISVKTPRFNEKGQVVGIVGISHDITDRKKIEESLKESELKYHSLFDNLPLTTNLMRYVLNDEGEVVDWVFEDMNSKTQKLLGQSKKELKGKSLMELMGQNHIALFLPVVNEIRRTGKVTTQDSHLEAMDMYHITTFAPLSNELFLTIDQDITIRKKAEEELKKKVALLDISYEAIFSWDLDKGILSWNRGAEMLYGYTEKEAIGRISHELLNTKFPLDFEEYVDKLVNDKIWSGELIHKTKNDKEIFVESRQQLILDNEVRKIIIETNRDISERKKAEEAISQSQKLLQDIIDGFPSPIFVKDTEGRFLTINKKLEELLGVKNEELIGKTDYDIITKELADYYRANDQKVIEEGKSIPIEEEADLIDGHHTFIANKFPIYDNNGEPYGVGSISTDISELKKTQEILKESEERLRLAQTLGNVGIWDWNTVTNELIFTPELEQLYGLNPGTIKTYDDWRQLTHPDDIGKIEAERDQNISNHEPFDLEFRIFHSSGELRWLSAIGGAIYNNEGDILRVLGVNTDITERKNAEIQLKESEELLDLAQKVSNVGAFEVNLQTGVNIWTRETEALYGLKEGEFGGTMEAWELLVHPEDRDDAVNRCNISIETGEPMESEWRVIWPDGSIHWIYGRWNVLKDDYKNPLKMIGVNIDITNRKKAEEKMETTMNELRRSNEELERFAYVSSHDLQEPLRMVTLYSQLLERRYKNSLDSDADDFIEYIVENAKRMKHLIDDLLEYSRVTSKAKEFENVDLEKILECRSN